MAALPRIGARLPRHGCSKILRREVQHSHPGGDMTSSIMTGRSTLDATQLQFPSGTAVYRLVYLKRKANMMDVLIVSCLHFGSRYEGRQARCLVRRDIDY